MSSTFNTLALQVQAVAREQVRLRQERAQLHLQVKAELVRVLERYRAHFAELQPELFEDRELTIPSERDILDSWDLDETDHMVFSLSYGFRGERCDYEVRLPARYLRADGEEQLKRDADAVRVQQAEEASRQQAEQHARDRELYEALKARFEQSEGHA